jgi:molybdate transport system regulatory protein
MAHVSLRVELGDQARIGPGKIRLLELIGEHGSISAAGRAMGMSYRRAWLLVDSLNACFKESVVESSPGGSGGGGARLTGFGRKLIARFRRIESKAAAAAAADLAALARARNNGSKRARPALASGAKSR